jgi:hypothetical protein
VEARAGAASAEINPARIRADTTVRWWIRCDAPGRVHLLRERLHGAMQEEPPRGTENGPDRLEHDLALGDLCDGIRRWFAQQGYGTQT